MLSLVKLIIIVIIITVFLGFIFIIIIITIVIVIISSRYSLIPRGGWVAYACSKKGSDRSDYNREAESSLCCWQRCAGNTIYTHTHAHILTHPHPHTEHGVLCSAKFEGINYIKIPSVYIFSPSEKNE